MAKPLVAIVTANSNSGSSCLQELVEKYNDKVQIRAVFRSEEKANPYRIEYPNLEVLKRYILNIIYSIREYIFIYSNIDSNWSRR